MAIRCANAQVFTLASIGYLSFALMWLWKNTAVMKMTENSMSVTAMWRVKVGGIHTSIHSYAR